MKIISKLLTGAATAAAIVASSMLPAEARPQSYYDNHVRMAEAVERAGIDFKINPDSCWEEENLMGWYYAPGRELVVCQENAYRYSGQVDWTDEDLDTLRHEVHHLVQDCRNGRLDGYLHQVYEDPAALAKDWLGYGNIALILDGYSDYDAHRQMMELEAFSVAEMDDPAEQLRDLANYCGV